MHLKRYLLKDKKYAFVSVLRKVSVCTQKSPDKLVGACPFGHHNQDLLNSTHRKQLLMEAARG